MSEPTLPGRSRTASRRHATQVVGLGKFPLAALLVCFAAALAFGGTFTAFGPETFPRGTGAPRAVVKRFSVRNASAFYLLRATVQNPTIVRADEKEKQGKDALTLPGVSATIVVNGMEILSPKDFTQNTTVVERAVSLKIDNEIDVTVRGPQGGAVIVEIIGTDNDRPTITAEASPSPNANGWNNTSVTVTFTCADATSGIATCSSPVTVATEGAGQVVTGTAVDKAGNSASTSVTLNIDKTPPVVTGIASPAANGNGWNNTDVVVTFACSDVTSGIATCPGPVTVTTEGAGQVVSGTAVDKAGNRGSTSVTLNVDKTAPTITATAAPPPNANGWNNGDVTVTFSCADNLSQVATCPGPVTVTAEGTQTVSGTAVDRAGNQASTSVTVRIDKSGPIITATRSPEANANGWNNTDVVVTFTCSDGGSQIASCPEPVTVGAEGEGQVVSGTATDEAGNTATTSVTVSIDKTPPTIAATAVPPPNASGWNNSDVTVTFSCADSLSQVATCPEPVTVMAEGTQTVSGTAVDRAGNQASTSVTVHIDKSGPIITATRSPEANANGWNNTDVTVSFTCSDAGSGVESCAPPVTISSEGENQVASGTATDRAGNGATASVNVSLDKTPPSLTITSPSDGALASESPITVTGSSDDGLSGLDHVSCNGAAALVSGSTFTCQVPLSQGPNPITVEAVDRAGNAATRSITVNLLPRLLVTITSPASLALFRSGPVTVTGTVDRPVVSVDVNGVAAVVSGQSFTAEGVPLREGHNLLTATATDAGGNVGSGSITVTLDTTPPTIHIDAPTEGAILTTAQVTVTGMINDIVTGTVNAEQATVIVNGVDAVVSNRSFVVGDLLLARGLNTITAIARDRAGNESQTQVHVTFQDVAGQQRIVMLSGNNQSGVIGTALPEPLVVSVQDAFGRALPGRRVTFTVARTDGVVKAFPDEGRSVTVVSDDRGQASALFQLGTRTGAGNNQVAVTSPGFVGELMFCASATVGLPVRINPDAVMGESFVGIVGAPLSMPFVVIVLDAGGNPVSGVPVTFGAQGGGHFGDGRTMVTTSTDSDGKAAVTLTLSEQPGISNNIVAAAFENMEGAPVVFKATGVAPGPAAQTRVSGVVLDNTDHPVPNASAKIVGTPLAAMTNDHGQFSIAGAPVGTITLIVDGRTSTRPETFPFLAFQMMTIAGQDNTIGMPIYLPPLNTEGSQLVGGDQEVTLTMPGVPGLAFTVFPHSTTFPDGSKVGRLTVSQVHADKVPMPPPYGTAPRIVWTLQPAGVHFDPPVRVQLPNADGLPPGQVIEVFQFDHDIEQFVSTGAARVSEDGSVIVSDAGFGITKSGWGGAPPPPPPKKVCLGSCDDKKPCTDDRCENGQCVHVRNIPPGEVCHKVEIDAEAIDQDDPKNTSFAPLGGSPVVYGGSVDFTSDNLKVKAVVDPSVPATSYQWSVSGPGSYSPPGSQPEWDLGDISPDPGTLKFKLVVNFADGETSDATKDVEVGIRTDDEITVGWINPAGVTLPAGASPNITSLMPPGGPSTSSLTCNLFILDLSENFTTPNFTTLTPIDRTYVLFWMFKYGSNADPSTTIPGGDFQAPDGKGTDESKVSGFYNTPTNYKLFNRLQLKYRLTGSAFKGSPTVLKRQTGIGTTENPCGSVLGFLGLFPGQQGPNNGPPPVIGSDHVSLINDGSPDSGAIRAFNTLTGKDLPPGQSPVFWENIGSQVRFTAGGGTSATVLVQPYPTYYQYRNGQKVNTTPQAATPLGHFYPNPYPFGTVPCLGLGGITPGGRCGYASDPAHPSARVPPFTVP